MTIRKGQKLINYLRHDKGLGFNDAAIRRYIFNMPDKEFYKVFNMQVDYEIPVTEEGDKAISEQVKRVLAEFNKLAEYSTNTSKESRPINE